MKKSIYSLALIKTNWFVVMYVMAFSYTTCQGQSFLNGDFENNTAGFNRINQDNADFNNFMSSTIGFGWRGNLDIITTAQYQGGPQSGDWFIALTGGGSDVISMELDIPLVTGRDYVIKFYDKGDENFVPELIEIGVSNINNDFGALVYTTPVIATYGLWSERMVKFTAPTNAQYITARQKGVIANWVQIDNFAFEECNSSTDLGRDTTLCYGDSLVLVPSGNLNSLKWQDDSEGTSFVVRNPGEYWVEVEDSCGTSSDTIIVDFYPEVTVDLGLDTTLCFGDSLILKVGEPGGAYLWQDNSTDSIFTATEPGEYWVQIADSCGFVRDTIKVDFHPEVIVELGADTMLCPGTLFTLDASLFGGSHLWQDGSMQTTFTVDTPGQYWVEILDSCGSGRDTIVVDYYPETAIELGADTTLCLGETLLLSAGSLRGDFLWQDNSQDSTLTVSQSGTYWVQVEDECGIKSDTIEVDFYPELDVNLGPDTVLCPGDTLTLIANAIGGVYLWQDNSDSSVFVVTDPGMYWVRVEDVCGAVSDTIQISFSPDEVIDIGSDTTLCSGETLLLDATTAGGEYNWQNNSSAPTFTVSESGIYWVEVSGRCTTMLDSIEVDYYPATTVDLGIDTTLCPGESLILDVSTFGDIYRWQDNSNNATYNISSPGIYWVEVTNECSINRDSIVVDYAAAFEVDLGMDTTICEDATLPLNLAIDGATYRWQDNSNESSLLVDSPGDYWVEVTRCQVVSDTISVYFEDCSCHLYTPNVFSPNGDRINDQFMPHASCDLQLYSLSVYGRWGELVFQSSQIENGWDGTFNGELATPDAYVYVIEYQFDSQEEKKFIAGDITVIR